MGVSRFADAGAQRPPRLRQGARVAVVAPSSAIPERSQLDRGLKVLEQFGLEVVLGPHVRDLDGYLGGDDRARADDLFWALSDPVIDGVVCARGGYGGQRTLAALGADRIAELEGLPAKPVIGFSDITILHAFLSVRLGWVSFYGPGVSKLGGANEYTLAGVRRALFDAEPFTVAPNPADDWITTLVPGTAEGVLAGGVLPRLASLVGTPLQVDFADRVCFFEDTNGTIMGVDDNLSQLIAAGCFDGCRGIAIGDHVNVTERFRSLPLERVFADLLEPLGIPCCYFLPLGHGPYQATVPIGGRVRLDADRGILAVTEAPVT